ncbi:MAG: histidine phosphatase family protein [Chloroflexi bacterium]|nr:histidine phosphatase family protein [Chloroflexota bacterium]
MRTESGAPGYQTEDTMLNAPRDRSVALLLRHSARYPILDGNDPYQAQLTPDGVRMAEDLGRWMGRQGMRLGGFYASPVGRCIDTAMGIARRAGYWANVRPEEKLSFPYMQPTRRNIIYFRASDPLPERVVAAMRFMLGRSADQPAFQVCVSHDSYLACILAHVFLEPIEEHWPEFLEGLAMWREGDEVILSWRGRMKRVSGI